MSGWIWALCAGAGVLGQALMRRPGVALAGWAVRSGGWLAALWLLQGVGSTLGLSLGVNPVNAMLLGALGVPGLALLLLVQWLVTAGGI